MKRFIRDHVTRFSVPPPRRAWFGIGPMWTPDRTVIGVAITIGNFHFALHRTLI